MSGDTFRSPISSRHGRSHWLGCWRWCSWVLSRRFHRLRNGSKCPWCSRGRGSSRWKQQRGILSLICCGTSCIGAIIMSCLLRWCDELRLSVRRRLFGASGILTWVICRLLKPKVACDNLSDPAVESLVCTLMPMARYYSGRVLGQPVFVIVRAAVEIFLDKFFPVPRYSGTILFLVRANVNFDFPQENLVDWRRTIGTGTRCRLCHRVARCDARD